MDTFGFNRLCAYRGTPLWQEYVDRGIIDDERDWQKWFKCTDIDPTALVGAGGEPPAHEGLRPALLRSRVVRRPLRTYKLLRTFSRHMKKVDILRLLASPFRRRTLTRLPELPVRMLEAGLAEPLRVGNGSGAHSGPSPLVGAARRNTATQRQPDHPQ